MKTLLLSSLAVAIAATFSSMLTPAISTQPDTVEFEQSELLSQRYTYRRFRGGTGRREILS